MKLTVCFLLFCAAFCVGETINSPENAIASTADGILGFGLEMLLTKLENVDRKLFEMLEYRVQMESYKASLENTMSDLLLALRTVNSTLGRQISVLQNQSSLILEQQKTCQPAFASCSAVTSKISGIYLIRVNEASSPFEAFCEQERNGGGWLVVQHRFNGSVDFYRNWTQYREGFGDLNGEFWFGLEKMHQITTTRPHEIMIELKDFSGIEVYARYDVFKIGSENEDYKLTLGKYSGTAGDGMIRDNGMKFSTKDRDNDRTTTFNCVEWFENPWWQNSCSGANLNARYINAVDRKSMHWLGFKGREGLSLSKIMIRELP
ncbi:fibrinogen C domain-containing protein 1-like [Anopheles aquasalis]|uniref:fibrinogen C domain-containing protein 1-like n=1 Tax=Anopheles aquasalis TaxID=42839 RepID=UPI00215B5F31|nr:fibrinogen C domain-containing protein 1-like [Anopheles aquasalis]